MKHSSSVQPSLKLEQEQADGGGLNSLELRLGISSDNGGSSPWLGVGVDPWSLAARQEKATLEQANQRDSRAAAAPQLVGWPPVRAFRKNLSGAKPADGAEEVSKVKHGSDDGPCAGERTPATMFVKVNLEGCTVGRKVDLQAHRGYGSLSRALQSMFHGFLSDGCWRIAAKDDDDEQHQQQFGLKTKGPKTYILLYEDNEGDRMLVGDVPWELFIASVKRLYIAQDTRAKNKSNRCF